MPENVGEKVTIDRSSWLPTPAAPWSIVSNRFDTTMAIADDMIEKLIGSGHGSDGLGKSGYLGLLNTLIEDSAPVTDISAEDVDTSLVVSPVKTPPSFNGSIADFPTFTAPDPGLVTIPMIDVGDLKPPSEPKEINPVIDWSEINLSLDIYPQLLTRISNDLVSGATGLTAEVQDDIFASGQERQRRSNDKAYQSVQNDIAARGSFLPSGALLAAITEISAEILSQSSELNRTITIEQAQLAQKNSQFVIEQARLLETVLRDTRDKESDRKLDYAKAVSMLVVQVYVENVKMYIAIAEANKMYVEAQVANLQGVVAYNNGLVEQYKALVEVFTAKIGAIAAKNASLSDVYKSEILGYDSETSAISKVDMVKLEKIKLDIMGAQQQLDAEIANAANLLQGYTTESALKEKISNDMASIANQALVGALSSVNANASLGYSGSESKSETWGHSDSLSESHGYPHDPID